ncbi:MAG: ACP phosphodiesterase [Bacteroidota bacterium]|nr:ACP phosphodiesterase [Bacteroidota bacterium]
MNYLAHAYLSNNNPDLLIGNFIADHLQGNNFENFSEGIKQGITLHRAIDTFTDNHPNFKLAKRLFYNGFEKHSGILIDIYFDYFLAKNFHEHSPIPLPEFCINTYSVYQQNVNVLPQGSQQFLNYVLKNNIYEGYGTIKGIETVLFHLSKRINHDIWLNESIILFQQNETELYQHFNTFFKDAKNNFSV